MSGVRQKAAPVDRSLTVTPELVETFLHSLQEKGRTKETVLTYRRSLTKLYGLLPEGHRLADGTLGELRDALVAAGYAPRTVNGCISAANSLLEFYGYRDLQLGEPLKCSEDVQPELTRSEYLQLLSAARRLGKERTYLLVKVFAATGVTIQELPLITVEAAEAGRLALPTLVLRIPPCLRTELLDYAERKDIVSGPVFVTKTGKHMNRNGVTMSIQALCRVAQVPEGKANPRCLRRLYQATQQSIMDNIAFLVEQAQDRLLEKEQLTIGWKQEVEAG